MLLLNGPMDSSNQPITEDSRALQLALELSMIGFNDLSAIPPVRPSIMNNYQELPLHHEENDNPHASPKMTQHAQFDINAMSAAVAAAAASNCGRSYSPTTQTLLPSIEERSKKSQNMTECVPVPSSEHVAEIVGRQGCKIKALRAKTNTYIKTPVRNEEPVFVVTGRKEDVAKAKREILSAAEHFSLIRATRKPLFNNGILEDNVSNGAFNKSSTSGPAGVAGQVTIQVRVPYRVVGLVVGPKGATIKHIQHETQTYIVTPSREKEPIFEVTGLPENVHSARKQIEAHIALRTGTASPNLPTPPNIPTLNNLSQILNQEMSSDFLASLYKNNVCSNFEYMDEGTDITATSELVLSNLSHAKSRASNALAANTTGTGNCDFRAENLNLMEVNAHQNLLRQSCKDIEDSQCLSTDFHQNYSLTTNINTTTNNSYAMSNASNAMSANVGNVVVGNNVNISNITRSCSSASSTASSKSANNSGTGSTNSSRPELVNIWKNIADSIDIDEGIGDSPNIWTLPPVSATQKGSQGSPQSNSISPIDSILGEIHNAPCAISTNPFKQNLPISVDISEGGNMFQQKTSSTFHKNTDIGNTRRECLVCRQREVTSALVPCGHNVFCMECANDICSSSDPTCPVCNLSVYHAMRIIM